MATGNFYQQDSSRIFAVLMSYHCDETNEYIHASEFEYDDIKDCVSDDLASMAKAKNIDYIDNSDKYSEGLRSYPQSNLCEIYKEKTYLDVGICVKLECIITSGYYEGANLDYRILYEVDGYDTDKDYVVERFAEICEYNDTNKGLIEINKSNVSKFIDKTEDMLRTEVENIYKQHSDHVLSVGGRFSNGEVIYSKV
jgi:hypothetical protein